MKHAVIWIDQKEARIFEVDADRVEESMVSSPGPHIHRHANGIDLRVRNHPDDEHRYFREVAHALEGHGQVLLVGPAQTKLHFFRYVHEHDRQLEAKSSASNRRTIRPTRSSSRICGPTFTSRRPEAALDPTRCRARGFMPAGLRVSRPNT